MTPKIVIDSVIKTIKSNPSSIRIIDLIYLCESEKFKPYKTQILEIPFSDLINEGNISTEEECEAVLIENYKEIVNLNLSEIMKRLKIQNKPILTKTLKFLEHENSSGYRIAYSGERKGKRYTLLKKEDYDKKMNSKNSVIPITESQSIEDLLDQEENEIKISTNREDDLDDISDDELEDDDFDLDL